MQHAVLVLFVGAWGVLLAVAPLLLVLVLFGLNYTVQWLIAAAGLLGVSVAALGLYLVVEWIDGAWHGMAPGPKNLLGGLSLVASTASAAFLIWHRPTDLTHPYATIGAAAIVVVSWIGWMVDSLVTDRQTPLASRILSAISTLCLIASLMIFCYRLLLQRPLFGIGPATGDAMRDGANYLVPIGLLMLFLSNVTRTYTVAFQWRKRTSVFLVIAILAVGALFFIVR